MITSTRYLPSLWHKLTTVPSDLCVTLIGMPGCGKSHWAHRISKNYRRFLIELDERIERRAGQSLMDLASVGGPGEAVIQYLENDVMRGAMQQHMHNPNNGAVLSPGGSCVYAPCAEAFFAHPSNVVVYLDVPLETLVERTCNFTNRGIVFGDHTPESLKAERDVLYNRFCDVKVTFEANKLNIEEEEMPAQDILDYFFK